MKVSGRFGRPPPQPPPQSIAGCCVPRTCRGPFCLLDQNPAFWGQYGEGRPAANMKNWILSCIFLCVVSESVVGRLMRRGRAATYWNITQPDQDLIVTHRQKRSWLPLHIGNKEIYPFPPGSIISVSKTIGMFLHIYLYFCIQLPCARNQSHFDLI